MKRTGICFLTFIAFLVTSCQQPVDLEAEKEAIIKVIEAETQAYLDFDFEKVISFYVQDSLNFRLTTGADDHIFLQGWDEVEAFFREDLIENDPDTPSDTHIKVEKDSYKIKVYENSAYVICNETWTYTMPKQETEIKSLQVRFMEKIDGEWKIAFLSFIGTSGYEEEELLDELGVDFNAV